MVSYAPSLPGRKEERPLENRVGMIEGHARKRTSAATYEQHEQSSGRVSWMRGAHSQAQPQFKTPLRPLWTILRPMPAKLASTALAVGSRDVNYRGTVANKFLLIGQRT